MGYRLLFYRVEPFARQSCGEPLASTLTTRDSSEQKARVPVVLRVSGYATTRNLTFGPPSTAGVQSDNSNRYPFLRPLASSRVINLIPGQVRKCASETRGR